MPIVTIQVTREGTTLDRQAVTAEEKAALIHRDSCWRKERKSGFFGSSHFA